jgi:hypothetical protein
MAIQTKQDYFSVADPTDATKKATLSFTYDDVTLLIKQIIIVNGTTFGAFGTATSTANNKNYSTNPPVAAGQSLTITINNGQTQQLQIKVSATNPNRLDGVEWAFYLV